MKLNLPLYVAMLLLSPLVSWAGEVDDESDLELMSLYGGEEFISIATGSEQPIHKAPAVASVVTEKQIEQMGATDIDEILETIPGLHVARDAGGYNPIYTFRGIYASYNPQVLMLINGIPITNLFQGDRNLVWGGMPVQAISRIEVIRGPGSALYGADAFAGVINIVTHEADGVSQFKTGVRYGTHNTKDYWLSGGGSVGELKYYGIVESHETDGFDEKIKSDQQSIFDSLLPTDASLAPGSVNMERENIDARAELAYKNFRLRAGAQIREDAGDYAGAAQALAADNEFSSDRLNVDLTYENDEFLDNLAVKVQSSYLHTTQDVEGDLVLFPAGTMVPPLGEFNVYPDGVIGTPELKERHTRFNFSSLYTGIKLHLVRVITMVRFMK